MSPNLQNAFGVSKPFRTQTPGPSRDRETSEPENTKDLQPSSQRWPMPFGTPTPKPPSRKPYTGSVIPKVLTCHISRTLSLLIESPKLETSTPVNNECLNFLNQHTFAYFLKNPSKALRLAEARDESRRTLSGTGLIAA